MKVLRTIIFIGLLAFTLGVESFAAPKYLLTETECEAEWGGKPSCGRALVRADHPEGKKMGGAFARSMQLAMTGEAPRLKINGTSYYFVRAITGNTDNFTGFDFRSNRKVLVSDAYYLTIRAVPDGCVALRTSSSGRQHRVAGLDQIVGEFDVSFAYSLPDLAQEADGNEGVVPQGTQYFTLRLSSQAPE